jgi:hypothetical protein
MSVILRSALTLSIMLLFTSIMYAQSGELRGKVTDRNSKEPVPFANIVLENTNFGTISDIDGNFEIKNITPGVYTILCSFIGYQKRAIPEIAIGTSKPISINIELSESVERLEAVEIRVDPFIESAESPVSLRTINTTEIMRNPGGNRDISKVIQSLPGVATTVSFRNDIIIRGGAPNENRFYLDDIEVPNINHFATQGSSGGPVGMINVNFIREVDFYAGAFPANRNNALSSVMNFKQINGNTEKLAGTFMVGSSDIGITLDGPMGKNSTFVLSARRSYLQFLFKALKLPFLPTYNDFQYKQTFNLNKKSRITVLGLGAIDDFVLNEDVNKNVTDSTDLERNNYILNNLPINTQWNYTFGAKWEYFSKTYTHRLVASRSHLNNESYKYKDNIESPENLLYDYSSQEIENNLRYEVQHESTSWNYSFGLNYQYAKYTNSTFNIREVDGSVVTIDFDSRININKAGLYAQVNRQFFANRLSLSLGLRTDFNDYSNEMNNPLKQLSPRLSGSFVIIPNLNINFNVGTYYQLPSYTVLGYRNTAGELVNKTTNTGYIRADHFVIGLETAPTTYSKLTLEGFYKIYDNYPLVLADSISLANLGGDFGVIGNEPVSPISKGKSYGIEFLAQQKLSRSVYGILAVTLVRSYFTNKEEDFVVSAWDNKQIISLTAGKQFNKNWQAGIKFRFQGGTPYTPYDLDKSATKEIWDVTQQGVYDWDKINSLRYKSAHGLDIRVDKKWFFKKWSLNAYVDIQNIYNFQIELQPYLTVQRDDSGLPIEDPTEPTRYLIKPIENIAGTVLPSIGLMIEF